MSLHLNRQPMEWNHKNIIHKHQAKLLMALSFSSTGAIPCTTPQNPFFQSNRLNAWNQRLNVVTRCESKESSAETNLPAKNSKLEIGSPVVVVEAPKMIKTATTMPCLRVNSGLVKPGDVGRIVSRKPKDVWAVRLAIGTYLIDGKYFKPLEINE